jgi:hypothetical protein
MVEDKQDQIAFVARIEQHGPVGHSRAAGYHPDRRVVVAVLGKQRPRRLSNAPSFVGLLALDMPLLGSADASSREMSLHIILPVYRSGLITSRVQSDSMARSLSRSTTFVRNWLESVRQMDMSVFYHTCHEVKPDAGSGRHISKSVTRWCRGGINVVTNSETKGFAHSFNITHEIAVGLRIRRGCRL